MLRFCPLASGSSGNSVYVGTEKTHLLVDAGLSGKRLEKALASCKAGMTGNLAQNLSGILVTHEHTDHVRSLRAIARKMPQIHTYANNGTWKNIKSLVEEKQREVLKREKPFS